ncbi:uncharacterized protein LOC120774312 [Bactrocera tryoni]|uniref:uncharacterized protein LOC120774312 n=1 Tax=Bactrocera tryoni TaxID=59916 RepID=UPI001A99C35C|nr:uncharacterized protein LOC120774312 [Bactrocera tryoni]XP_039959780.1 uncharacterized protein LOC120774312 [Bactrocera tryoni]XP_039959781.1 uncharacterized protein LOC120774312 [Bactrocera tryoni]XP_039959782.1 uncharacterized protein LOC120774312 [Bactrocera tryoni]
MPHIAATGAAYYSATSTKLAPTTHRRWLTLFFVGCVASLCGNAVQASPLSPAGDYPGMADNARNSLQLSLSDPRGQTRRVACRRACWAMYIPEKGDCLKDARCYQCYLNCMTPPAPVHVTTTTTTSTTTNVPTTAENVERYQLQHKQQKLQQQMQQSSKINKPIQETWTLRTVSMLQQDSLVLVDIAWDALNTPNQCLISWEVSGGGLMGNLLTESSIVQLSLWPDTKYRVKVTCKNKLTGFMSRSLPLSIDTSEAVMAHEHSGQHKTQAANADATLISTTTIDSRTLPANKVEPQKTEQINSNAIDQNSNGNTEYVDADSSSNSNGLIADAENAAVLPYDERDDDHDQSVEALNRHTAFVFNWHSHNSDISLIEPIHKPDLSLLTMAIADMQKPFFFGLLSGIIMLVCLVLAYRCLLRRQRLAYEKSMLITDDAAHAVVSVAPAEVAMRLANNKAAARKAKEGGRHGCGAGVAGFAGVGSALGATSLAYQRSDEEEEYERGAEEVCSNPAICSRNALKV